MKRAQVWKSPPYGAWFVTAYGERGPYTSIHPTHAAALAHALAEVGLTEKSTEKEKDR